MAQHTISIHVETSDDITAHNDKLILIGDSVELFLGFSPADIAENAQRLTEAAQQIRTDALRRAVDLERERDVERRIERVVKAFDGDDRESQPEFNGAFGG
jgi:hypothetical protein